MTVVAALDSPVALAIGCYFSIRSSPNVFLTSNASNTESDAFDGFDTLVIATVDAFMKNEQGIHAEIA